MSDENDTGPKPKPWEVDYPNLPPDKQDGVESWLGTQIFIAESLGLPPEAWFELLAWAFENPDDTSFLTGAAVALGGLPTGDELEDGAEKQRSGELVGTRKKDLGSIPKVGEKPPEGAISVSLLNFPRRG